MAKEHHYAAHLTWTGAAAGATRTYEGYARDYRALVVGKPPLEGSADPTFRGDPAKHNPEDLLVVALAACHMLTYLALCARAGIEVQAYEDQASGVMAFKDGKLRFTEVTLAPRVVILTGDLEQAFALHATAHADCFIASSVSFPVRNLPIISAARAGSGAGP